MLLLSSCYAISYRHAIRRAFEKQHGHTKGLTTHSQLRRVMRDLGTDLSRENTDRLVHMYAQNTSSITIEEVDAIVDHSMSASPSKHFWLHIDPDGNGIREKRPNWNRFGYAGLRSPDRIAHYGVGLLALVVGAFDLVDFVQHAGLSTLPIKDAFQHGALHTLVAVLSLTRFKYRWDPVHPLHSWMPTAREANMWPSFIIYAWYTLGFVSDFVCLREDALFTFNAPPFLALTWFATVAILYGTARTVLETDGAISGVYKTRISNTLQVIGLMGIPITADSIKCLVVAREPYYSAYIDMVSQHPVYTQIYTGAFLTAMFLGNLACALSSAEHHAAITKSQIGDFINALTGIVTILSISAMLRVEDGMFAVQMMGLVWCAMSNQGP